MIILAQSPPTKATTTAAPGIKVNLCGAKADGKKS